MFNLYYCYIYFLIIKFVFFQTSEELKLFELNFKCLTLCCDVFSPRQSLDHTAVNLTYCPAPPFFFPSLSNQERRIDSLDAANSRLMAALTQVKERYNTPSIHNGLSPSNPTKLSITETGEFKNSSC